ncbi:MAG: AI-2E family transporter [Prevotella sp.]|nr:AI-2E family transporter [Prevotella sp.]
MQRETITFDRFVRGLIGIVMLAGLVWLLSRLSGVLTPFFVAWLLAYLLFPMVKFFQYRCHLRFRIVGILCTFTVVGLVLWGGFMLIVPPFIDEGVKVKDLMLAYAENNTMLSSIPSALQQFIHDHLNVEQMKAIVTQEGFISEMKSLAPRLWDFITQSVNMVWGLFSLTMILLYTLFILIDYEEISEGWLRFLPLRWRGFAQQLVSDVTTGMNCYFRSQALVALLVGVLFSIGFLIIGFPLAIGLGLFIGLLNMVPYLQTVGLLPTILLAIVKSADTGQNFWVVLLMALVVFAVVQVIQDTILVPRIMGKTTGLYPAIILLSLSVWGSLLGILGMVIALPLTTLIQTYYQRYLVKE